MLPDIPNGTIILGVISILIATLFWLFTSNKRKPPGPYGLPIVGYMPFMTSKPYLKLIELQKKYGSVYSIRMGSHNVIILSDYKTIKEAFSRNAFAGQPPVNIFEFTEETHKLGVFYGLRWKEQRRFALHMFHDLGFAGVKIEPHLKEEISELLGRLENETRKPIVAAHLLAPSTSNNISSLVFGKRRRFDDPKRVMLDDITKDFSRLTTQVNLHFFFPWIRKLARFLQLGRYKKLIEVVNKMLNYVDEEIVEHKKTFDPDNIRDFMDGYMLEIKRRKGEQNTTFIEPVMKDLVRAFFGAGSETVRTTMDWLLLISAAFPEVQKKVQTEIDDIVGRDKLPSYDNHKRMPYTQAVITEMMRWRTIVPINLLRYTLEDTELNSYFIPRSTYVIANLWAVHHDPELWGDDVEDFKPERFLSTDGKEFKKPEYFIPFSVGKRACPGKSLAETEVFLYFTSILQKFQVRLPEGAVPNLEGTLGIALQPTPYEIIFELR